MIYKIIFCMEYRCQHCDANLDDGDIFERFLLEYEGDHKKAKETANCYGWTENNRIHFNRSIIIQPNSGPQYVICPDCNKKDPIKKTYKKEKL